jgi:hypothetical protein
MVEPPLEAVKVLAGSESFDCTGGHLFWVCAKGWIRACELHVGHVLHGVAATTLVGAGGPLPFTLFSLPSYGRCGSVIVKTVPSPGWLSTSIRPPWLVTIRQHLDNPRPSPRPACRAE